MKGFLNYNLSTLGAYTPTPSTPWNSERVRLVFNRLAFGIPENQLSTVLNTNPQDLINQLLNDATSSQFIETPIWATWGGSDFEDYSQQNKTFRIDLLNSTMRFFKDGGLRSRLTLFWLNHFVAEIQVVRHTPYHYQHVALMEQFAVGNFKNFVLEVSRSSPMLVYLGGFNSTNELPNENYARELLELFTLGVNNGYDQNDIEEIARALTGYNHNEAGNLSAIIFDESTHDTTTKTIFGREGNWNLEDVITILFEERGALVAKHICTKIYNYFVSPITDEDVVEQLSTLFVQHDFELLPVFEKLFKSEHFFDDAFIGALIKSPVDLVLIFHNQIGLDNGLPGDEFEVFLVWVTFLMGQSIFQPPDVSGWGTDQDWLSAATLASRWISMNKASNDYWSHSEEQFRSLAKRLSDTSSDPRYIVEKFIDTLIPKKLENPNYYLIAEEIFKWEVPMNYYETNTWNLNWSSAPLQTLLLLQHIFQIPEFQLK